MNANETVSESERETATWKESPALLAYALRSATVAGLMWARENNGQAAVATLCEIERDKPMCIYTDRSQLALTMLQLIVYRIFRGAYLVLSLYT